MMLSFYVFCLIIFKEMFTFHFMKRHNCFCGHFYYPITLYNSQQIFMANLCIEIQYFLYSNQPSINNCGLGCSYPYFFIFKHIYYIGFSYLSYHRKLKYIFLNSLILYPIYIIIFCWYTLFLVSLYIVLLVIVLYYPS